jgi:hypothetical protein
MAGVVIFHPEAIEPAGHMAASLATEYQTNSGLINYSLRFGGNKKGFVWNGRYSEKFAHAYHNKYDGYVPGTQFHERAANALLGLNKEWGFTHLTLGYYHITPSITEGERDPETGDLLYDEDQYSNGNLKTYRKALPYQQIHHYKAVLDKGFDAVISSGLSRAQTIEKGKLRMIIYYLLKNTFLPAHNRADYEHIMKHYYVPEDAWENVYPTLLPQWDRTPRAGVRTNPLTNSTPEKFQKTIEEAITLLKNKQPEHQILFLKSWNEWGEGNYVEPDLRFGHGYLQAIRQAIESSKK